MNRDKKKLYILSFFILAVLLLLLFVSFGSSRFTAACVLLLLAPLTFLLIKKRGSVSIQSKEILLLSAVLAVISAVFVQLTGLYFGFFKNPYFVKSDTNTLLDFILPLATIIIATEIIRSVMLSQKNKAVSAITYVSCVIAETLMFSNLTGISGFNNFMDLIGLTFFPAISANVYYHYISKRYGMMPNIAFRLISTLYIYFIPTVTGMSNSLTACFKIILPIVMLSLVSAMFEKKKRKAVRKGQKIGVIGTILTAAFILSVAMLISCQFRFGALVIATDSMTGEINKGDMILYERYDGQFIQEGQVIVFIQRESKIVHRVIKIENIGGEIRYYTKGDANEDPDYGYRLESDIVGLTDVKLAYIGYPTLWLRELIKN